MACSAYGTKGGSSSVSYSGGSGGGSSAGLGGYGGSSGGGSSGGSSGRSRGGSGGGRISAAVQTTHSFEVKPVQVQNEIGEPAVIEVSLSFKLYLNQ